MNVLNVRVSYRRPWMVPFWINVAWVADRIHPRLTDAVLKPLPWLSGMRCDVVGKKASAS